MPIMVFDVFHRERLELAGDVRQVVGSILALTQEIADGVSNTCCYRAMPTHGKLTKLPIDGIIKLYLRSYHAYMLA